MYLYPDRAIGRARIRERFLDYSARFAEENGVDIVVELDLLDEAFRQAYDTAQFHGIIFSELSHYKELAHIGYWVAELKPIQLSAPMSLGYTFDRVAAAARRANAGPTALVQSARRSFTEAEKRYKKFSKYPVSEDIALRFIADQLEAEFIRKIDLIKSSDADAYEAAFKRFQHFKHVFYRTKEKFNAYFNVVLALRYHVFTPRSFSTLVETTFAFEGG